MITVFIIIGIIGISCYMLVPDRYFFSYVGDRPKRARGIPDFKLKIPPPPKPTKIKDMWVSHNCRVYDDLEQVSHVVVWQFERLIKLEYKVDWFSGHPADQTLFSRNTVTGIWHVKHKDLCNTQK
jgi:hypothetical protein